jgi:hypothetical protein
MSKSKTVSPSASTVSTKSTNATQIQMPPKVTVPVPPDTYDPNVVVDYRSAQPRQGELASIAGAAQEVGAFPDWVAVFGKTAPPAEHVLQAFDAAAQWTTLLVASTLWFNYVRAGAAVAWQDSRGLVEDLKTPFQLASAADPTIATAYPAITRLLGVAKAIAQKGVATRKANAKAKAEGRLPTHGKVGKSRKKQAALAALAAATTAAPPPTPATPEAPAAAPAVAAPTATNGAAHA